MPLISPNRHRLLIHLSLLIIAVLIVLTIASLYVTNEHTFYWWDYVGYQRRTLEKAGQLRESLVQALSTTWQSTGDDYNSIPTLLLAPFTIYFGNSRLVYILSIALVYLLPFALILGAIAVQLIPVYPQAVYWSTVFLTLLIPAAWAPSLRGYVDSGAASLTVLALWLYLGDLQLKSRWRMVAIGFLMTTAILFRRHFAYAGIAFYLAMTSQVVLTFIAHRRKGYQEAQRYLYLSLIKIITTATISFLTLVVLGWHFLKKVLSVDFEKLYQSYEMSPFECLWYYGVAYGWIAWLLMGTGFVAGFRTRTLNAPVAIFFNLFGLFSLIIWIFKAKIVGIHYTTHFTSFVVLGLTVLGWTVWIKAQGKIRRVALSIGGIYLILNAGIGLGLFENFYPRALKPIQPGMSQIPDSTGTQFGELFSASYPPLNREDYGEFSKLIDYLHTLNFRNKPLYIAASSKIINQSIVNNAEQSLYPNFPLISLLTPPQVDSRDIHPLGELLKAGYVVVANPIQYHLRPEEQDVVKVVVDAFNEHWEITQDFQQLPTQFELEKGVIINIYKRVRPTSIKIALLTLDKMNQSLKSRPGGQSSWMNFSQVPGHIVARYRTIRKSQDVYYLKTTNKSVGSTTFVYLETLAKQTQISGEVNYLDRYCTGAVLQVKTLDREANLMNHVQLSHRSTDRHNFTQLIPTSKATHLLFELTVEDNQHDPMNHCSVRINHLELSAK